MKLNKVTLLTIGVLSTLVVAQKFYTYSFSLQQGKIELGSTSETEQKQESVRKFETATTLIDAIVQDAGDKKVIVINNIGFSAAGYANNGQQLVGIVQQEIRGYAQTLSENYKGGIIEITAGGTTDGVGKVVEAAMNEKFIEEIRKFGVEINASGVVSELGAEYLDKNLKKAAIIPDPNKTWGAFNSKGISSVVEYNIAAILDILKGKSNIIQAPLIVREGGAIGMNEALMYIMEINRIALEKGMTVEEVAKKGPLVLQVGLAPGDNYIEKASNKGPKAATQILYAFAQIAEASPEFRELIAKMNIEVQIFVDKTSVKPISFRIENSISSLKDLASKSLAIAGNVETAKAVFEMNVEDILEKEPGLSKEEIERKLGILTQSELNNVKARLKELLKEERSSNPRIQVGELTSLEAKDLMKKIDKTFIYRNYVVAYADALPTVLNELKRVNDIYKIEYPNLMPAISNGRNLIQKMGSIFGKIIASNDKKSLFERDAKSFKPINFIERAIEAAKRK